MPSHDAFPKTAATNVAIESADGVHFWMATADLARASTVFRDMFDVGKPTVEEPIKVTESALQLEILFQLVVSRATPLEKIQTVKQVVELFVIASQKYDIPSATQLLRYVTRDYIAKETNTTLRFTLAKECAMDDLASDALQLSFEFPLDIPGPSASDSYVRHWLHLHSERQSRIHRLQQRLVSPPVPVAATQYKWQKTGSSWHTLSNGFCGGCDSRHSVKSDQHHNIHVLEKSIMAKYAIRPSMKVVLEQTDIQSILSDLYKATCNNRPMYPPQKVCAWLFELETAA